MLEQVSPDSLVTLHYRLSTGDDTELVSTFGATPATVQLGSGELAPMLERCLDGLRVGDRRVFTLAPADGFGPHNPDLVQRIARGELPAGSTVEVHGLIEFAAPGGGRFAGLVREMDAGSVLIDFNHPLAGKTIRFEVEVVGIL
jgi:FKBP-type peptidyl-prolyl cis-trans isomerase SlpA